MTTLTWTGPSGTTASPKSGSWNTASNWSGSPQRVPTSSDTAVLGGGSTIYTVTLDSADTIGVLTISDSNATLSFNANLTLTGSTSTNAGKINLNGSTLSHTTTSGSFTNTGTITIGGGTLSQTGFGSFTNSSGTISGYGTVIVSGGNAVTGHITASGGTLDLQAPVSTSTTLTIDSATTSTLKLDYRNAVTIDVVSISNTNQTLEIGNNSNVTINNASESITNGKIILDGGTLTDTHGITIGSGATLTGFGIIGTNTAVGGTGTITASGGTLEFKGTVDTSNLTAFEIANVANSDLKFDLTVGSSGTYHPTITFDGQSSGVGTLDLTGAGTGFNGTVTNFVVGDKILVAGSQSGPDTVSFSNGVLTVKNSHGNTEATINMSGNYTTSEFIVTQLGSTDTITTTAICFYPGTLVRTPDGEVPVETLKRGDLVVTAEGAAKPVRWLGRQTVSTVFSDPMRVWPIRIKAGALGENMPSRDLRLSPAHAVLIDGALVQAGALVNGTSIVQEAVVPKIFVYYHVELDNHSLILAENTPAETFIDNVDRLAFDNWAEHEALYSDGKQIKELPYPRAKAKRQVPVAMRVRLTERALAIGAVTNAAVA